MGAQMIREGKSKEERFQILKEIADYQMKILLARIILCVLKKTVMCNRIFYKRI